jgi:hypothetical protein
MPKGVYGNRLMRTEKSLDSARKINRTWSEIEVFLQKELYVHPNGMI